jgi:hypothetical protein
VLQLTNGWPLRAAGATVNVMSTDVGKVTEGVFFLHIGLTAPLTVVVIIVLLWIEVGWAAVGCIVVTAVLLPTQGTRAARPPARSRIGRAPRSEDGDAHRPQPAQDARARR